MPNTFFTYRVGGLYTAVVAAVSLRGVSLQGNRILSDGQLDCRTFVLELTFWN